MTVSMSAVVRTTATITINGKTSTSVLHLGPRGADGTGGGGGGPIVAADITDVSAAGQAVLTGTPAEGRDALELGNSATRAVGTTAGTVAAGDDARLSDSREWTAATVDQAEAEAGTAITRRAWTALRVRQAIAAWWQSASSATGRSLVTAADAAAARTAIGAASASGAGIPSAFTSRALTDDDDGDTLVCATAQTATVNTGLRSGFGCGFKGTVSFSGTATVTDVRTTGAANPWCALVQTGTDTYDAVGGKA